jgi:hypothetical protein
MNVNRAKEEVGKISCIKTEAGKKFRNIRSNEDLLLTSLSKTRSGLAFSTLIQFSSLHVEKTPPLLLRIML